MYFGDGYMGGMHGLWWLFWIVLIGALVYSMWGRPAARAWLALTDQRRDAATAPSPAQSE